MSSFKLTYNYGSPLFGGELFYVARNLLSLVSILALGRP
jgi:hypothetical protein